MLFAEEADDSFGGIQLGVFRSLRSATLPARAGITTSCSWTAAVRN